MATQIIRRYGAPPGAVGVSVTERPAVGQISDPRFGSVAMYGILKRGPAGKTVQLLNRNDYSSIYGDPRDPNWHLFQDGSHLCPDAVDGFYSTGGGAGQLWMTRVALPNAREASRIFKDPAGRDVLKITAANEGRWGGQYATTGMKPLIVLTNRTFTLVKEGIHSNEFVNAVAKFGDNPQEYVIVGNTASDRVSGEVVFTVGSQFNLLEQSIAAPAPLSGVAEYSKFNAIAGTADYTFFEPLTGTVNSLGIALTGNGTDFTTELMVGGPVYQDGELRTVASITSATTATINKPFSSNKTATVLSSVSRTLTGTGTSFTAALEVGDSVYLEFDGKRYARTVASITSDTSLELTSGFPGDISTSIVEVENFTIVGTGTSFTTEIVPGEYLIDPNRSGEAVKVVQVLSATSLKIDRQFNNDFEDQELAVQGEKVEVELAQENEAGLSIKFYPGRTKPLTHFAIEVYFNGTRVLNVDDASLDPNDENFVEPLVNEAGDNIAFRSAGEVLPSFVKVTSLLSTAYTTSLGNDVRPVSGSGAPLGFDGNIVFVNDELDYDSLVGTEFYADPYGEFRTYYRIAGAVAPVPGAGTAGVVGAIVTGVSSTFLSEFEVDDFIGMKHSNEVRQVVAILSDTSLLVASPFTTDAPTDTVYFKPGEIELGFGIDAEKVFNGSPVYKVVYDQYLSGGYDGDLGSVIPSYFSRLFDLDNNPLRQAVRGRNQGLIRLAVPGVTDVSVQKAGINFASQEPYEFRGEFPSNINSASVAETYVLEDLGRSDFLSLAFPSYGYISNPFGPGERKVPLSGDIMGGESVEAINVSGYQRPFAGIRAVMSRVLRLPFALSEPDSQLANIVGIQPVEMLGGNVVVNGARIPSQTTSYTFLHIRRIQSHFVRTFLESQSLSELAFLPNQPELAAQLILSLESFARQQYSRGVFSRYLSFDQVVSINSASSQLTTADTSKTDQLVEIINGALSISMRYTPTGIVERLELDVGPDMIVSRYGSN